MPHDEQAQVRCRHTEDGSPCDWLCPAAWSVDHRASIVAQTESRPGPPEGNGQRWMERRPTGLGIASCSCGYTTGLIPCEQLPDAQEFMTSHAPADPVPTFADQYANPSLVGTERQGPDLH